MARKRTVANKILSGLLVFLVALAMGGILPVRKAQATISQKSDTLSRLQGNTAANHTVKFRTSVGVESSTDTITVTYPAGFTIGSVAFGDMDLEIDSACDGVYETSKTLAATAAAGTWGASFAGQVLTLTAPTNAAGGEIASNSCVQVEIGTNAAGGVNRITNPNPGSDTVYQITIGGTFETASGDLAVQILLDDAVNVTANVDESIAFAIADTTIGFGNLALGNARYATADTNGSDTDSTYAHQMTIATNATNGYNITYNGATLTSGSNTIDVAAITNDADGVPGTTEAFGMGFSTSGDATIASGYDHNATPANRDWAFVAGTTTQIVSETAPTNTETISAFYLANINGTTEAGSYSTDITFVATASF